MNATIEVIEYEPPHIFTLKQISDMETSYLKQRLQANDDGTLLTEIIEMEPGAAMMAILDKFAPMIEPQLKQSLLDLKYQLEGQDS